MIKIAIIGSREYRSKQLVCATLNKLKRESTGTEGDCFMELISGGAKGVDTWVKEWVDATPYMRIEVIKPINPADKFSYLLRNVEIITKANRIIAFWDGKSKGTKFVIDYAKKRGKTIQIIT